MSWTDDLYPSPIGYQLYPAAIDENGYYDGGMLAHYCSDINDFQYQDNFSIQRTSDTGKIYVTDIESGIEPTLHIYTVKAYDGTYTVTDRGTYGATEEDFYSPEHQYTHVDQKSGSTSEQGESIASFTHQFPVGAGVSTIFKCNLPIFDANDTEGIQAYIDTGDISNAKNYEELTGLGAHFKVYVEGNDSPPIKITWQPISEVIPDYVDLSFMMTQGLPVPSQNEYKDWNIAFSNGTMSYQWNYLEQNANQSNTSTIAINLRTKTINSRSGETEYGGIVKCVIHRDGTYTVTVSEDSGTTLEVVNDIDPEDDGYDDPNNNSDDTNHINDYNGNNTLTTTYQMSRDLLVNFGNWLWTASIFDNIHLLNTTPIENIVSVKAMPISLTGEETTVKLGNLDSAQSGLKIDNQSTRMLIGTKSVPRYYNSFLDYSPFTKLTIYLPYIGFKSLDNSVFMGNKIRVEYVFDVVTGMCEAVISCDNFYVGDEKVFQQVISFSGNCGIDVPISSSNRAQVESALIQNGIGAVVSAAGENPAGVVNSIVAGATTQFHTNSQGSPSPSCAAYISNAVYLVIDRPVANQNISGYGYTYGYPSYLTRKLSKLSGYTVVDNPKLDGINATDQEKTMISTLLTSGIYL